MGVIEAPVAAEEQPIATRGDVELRWLHRGGAAASKLPTRAAAKLRFPAGAAYAWAAGEASGMRALRRHLLAERQLPPDRVRATGYWKRGAADWDRHQPLE